MQDKTVKQCSQCGKLIKIKSKFDGSSKYCDKCAKEIETHNAMLRMKRMREKE
jgi:DNA-directed RNA polymerase subunit M/transcription elongation factor TFIIS